MPINQVKTPVSQVTHTNLQGGQNYSIMDPIKRLEVALSSCFFNEVSYYTPAETRLSALAGVPKVEVLHDPTQFSTMAEMHLAAIKAALDFDVEKTLQVAVKMRQEHLIRTAPQIILVETANHPKAMGTGLVLRYGPKIIQRPDEVTVCMAWQFHRFGKKVPMSLKKTLARVLGGYNEYNLAKYRMESRDVKMVDVVNLVHAKSEAITKLMKGELKLNEGNETWESLISREGSTKEAWTKAIPVMGHMALLRNLRNLHEKGVDTSLYLQKLKDGVIEGKQLPFRYMTAFNELKNAGAHERVLNAIEDCLDIAVQNLPRLSGKTAVVSDVSGSMRNNYVSKGDYRTPNRTTAMEIAILMAAVVKRMSEDAQSFLFATRLAQDNSRSRVPVMELVKAYQRTASTLGGNTEFDLFWRKALTEKLFFDRIIVLSDMQQSAQSGNTAELVKQYIRTVNPNVQIYTCQMAGYVDTVCPMIKQNVHVLSGWTPGFIKYILEIEKILQG